MLEGLGGQVEGLEASWNHLGGILEASWKLLEALGGSWRHLGGSSRLLGASWRRLGRILEPSWWPRALRSDRLLIPGRGS